MKAFFKNIQIIGRFGQMGRINCGVFGVFPAELSPHNLSSFSINQSLFLLRFLRHLKGIFIWDWDMNLGCKELDIQPSCVRSPCDGTCNLSCQQHQLDENDQCLRTSNFRFHLGLVSYFFLIDISWIFKRRSNFKIHLLLEILLSLQSTFKSEWICTH